MVGENNMKGISKLRKEYSQEGIDQRTICEDPLLMFEEWFEEAKRANVMEPNAMCLATCSKSTCAPSARYMLLKAFDGRGFVWYTNYSSRKGAELQDNPQAALCFWWGEIERSVRVEGKVERVSDEESSEYFKSRPVGARLGAVGSDQSSKIESRDALDAKFKVLEQEHLDDQGQEKKTVQRPQNWGGYRLVPRMMEFWKGRKNRVHDRLLYRYDEELNSWTMDRLQP